jgi:hypothetical protein
VICEIKNADFSKKRKLNLKEKINMKARLPQGMGGGAQNMNGMIKQAQKMQAQITELQEDIESREFTATAGGGAVEVVMSGRKEIKSLTIKPEVVDKDDIEMLQDLVISAFNDAVHQIEETSEKEMGAITGGVSFPGLF